MTDGDPDQTSARYAELSEEITALKLKIASVEAEVSVAREETRLANEEIASLRDIVVGAERDQQDLKTARARLKRFSFARLIVQFFSQNK